MTTKEAIQSLIDGQKIRGFLWDKYNYIQLNRNKTKCFFYSENKSEEISLDLILRIFLDVNSFVKYEEPLISFKDVPIGENFIYNQERLVKVKDDGNRNVIGFKNGKPSYTGYLTDLSKVKYPVTSKEFDESA